MIVSALKNIRGRLAFENRKRKYKEQYRIDHNLDKIVTDLRNNSFSVIPNYYSEEKCTQLRNEIDILIEMRRKNNNLWVDDFDADKRCFAAETDSEMISEYYNDPFLLSVAENYFGGKMENSNTLAARIDYKPGNIGSGQGWHRDGNHFQFKAIIYLCDVELENGPFQIVNGSHKFSRVLRDTLIMGAEPLNTRFSDDQVQKLINKHPDDYKILTAKAGTLVFADVSSIHTGKPLMEGGYRYTLFNYYYPSYDNLEERREFFKNIAKTKEYA